MKVSANSDYYREVYADVFTANEQWNALSVASGETFAWEAVQPTFASPLEGCEDAGELSDISGAAVLGYFGDFINRSYFTAGVIPEENNRDIYRRGVDVTLTVLDRVGVITR